jgi:manganese peroxidase
MRLQSDHLLARGLPIYNILLVANNLPLSLVDPRTACYWQKNIDDEDYMRSSFQKYMEEIATLGQDKDKMIDCSGIIPPPKPRIGKPHLPAGCSLEQIEKSVSS